MNDRDSSDNENSAVQIPGQVHTGKMDKFCAWVKETYSPPEFWLFAIVIVYISIAFVAHWLVDRSEYFTLLRYTSFRPALTMPTLAIAILFRCAYIMIYIRPDRLFHYFGKDLTTIIFSRKIIARAIPTFVLVTSCLVVFSSMKNSIPYFAEYIWDKDFSELDKIIHFGVDPWRIIAVFLNQPMHTFLISHVYTLWLFAVYFTFIWQVFDMRNHMLRMQYLLTFVITWIILGNVLAVVFASGGPVYYDYFVSGNTNPYIELMAYLNYVNEGRPILSFSLQEDLLERFQSTDTTVVGAGISAMPSLHVAMSTICALVAWRTNKVFGVLMSIYLILILIGSVHLAWHYAIDGYVSIILTILIWKLVGRAVAATQTRFINTPIQFDTNHP